MYVYFQYFNIFVVLEIIHRLLSIVCKFNSSINVLIIKLM